jgi:hypothetical protein
MNILADRWKKGNNDSELEYDRGFLNPQFEAKTFTEKLLSGMAGYSRYQFEKS